MPMMEIFRDDFNRPNSQTVGNVWTQAVIGHYVYDYGINNNELYATADDVCYFGIYCATALSAIRSISVRIVSAPYMLTLWPAKVPQLTGLENPNSGYGFAAQIEKSGANTYQLRIVRSNDYSNTILASKAISKPAPGDVIELSMTPNPGTGGFVLFLYYNGIQELYANDNYYSAEGFERVGVGMQMITSAGDEGGTGRIDDIIVSEWRDTSLTNLLRTNTIPRLGVNIG